MPLAGLLSLRISWDLWLKITTNTNGSNTTVGWTAPLSNSSGWTGAQLLTPGYSATGGGVTTNNMDGEDDLVASDVGGMSQWGTESLTGSDSLLDSANTQFSESNSGSDVGGMTQWGVDGTTASDVGGIDQWGVDSGSASDTLLDTANTNFTESNTGTDSTLYIASIAFIDAGTGSDTGGSQQSGIDSGTASDALLATNDPSPGCVESNSGSDVGGSQSSGVDALIGTDVLLATTNTVLIESNAIADSALCTSNTTFTENNTGSDSATFIATTVLIDATSGSDVGGIQSGGSENNTVSDALTAISNTILLEANTGVDSLLVTDNASFTDIDPANDTSSTGLSQSGGSATTNNMNGEDDLVGSDVGGMQSFSVDTGTGSDSFQASTNTQFSEGYAGADSSLNSSVFAGVEAVIITDRAFYTISPIFVESNTGSDSLLSTATTSLVDANTASDSDLFVNGTSFTEALTASDVGGMLSWLIDAVAGSDVGGMQSWMVEPLAGSDSVIFTDGFVTVEISAGSDSGGLTPQSLSAIAMIVSFNAPIPSTAFNATLPNNSFNATISNSTFEAELP